MPLRVIILNINNRIANSTGMAYVATSNSTSSKWCPWELGVADGLKEKVCILPIMDTIFNGQEYLGLYSFLGYEQIRGKDKYDFWVTDPQNHKKYVCLKSWLNGEKPSLH